MRYEFHPDALAEYEEATRYYAGCQEGLESSFMAAVEHTVQQILEAPEHWRILEEDIRRCLTRVFPYAVLYTIEKDYVLIMRLCTATASPVTGIIVFPIATNIALH